VSIPAKDMVIFFYNLLSEPSTELKHKGKFANQYSIGVKTIKIRMHLEKFEIGAPNSLDFIN
jgi:hypothetical protein